MTLRFRLLMVYLIVVLLSAATVGVAVYELGRADQIIRELQDWNDIVLSVQKLRAASPQEADLRELIAPQYRLLADYFVRSPDYLDVDRVREALNNVQREYERWLKLSPAQRVAQTRAVRASLDRLAGVLVGERYKLDSLAGVQRARTEVLLRSVIVLTCLHVIVIGALLRRWLLYPMERLNRQVEALARDEPAPESLVETPLEMANLAQALDRARRSLGTLRQQLLKAERMTTIGELAAQLAHNLRNPLATIRATAQLTARHETQPPSRQRMEDIIASVDRMNRWIASLMEVARQQPAPLCETDAVPTLVRVAEAVQPELDAKEISLTLNHPPEGLICRHDPDTLEHGLVAMMINAIEASPVGGAIELAGRALWDDKSSETDNGVDPPSLNVCRISVRDHGPGLPTDEPERVFSFSYSTKQRGMGLGLALAREALGRQGGRTHAANHPEGGAMVCVDLPMAWARRRADGA